MSAQRSITEGSSVVVYYDRKTPSRAFYKKSFLMRREIGVLALVLAGLLLVAPPLVNRLVSYWLNTKSMRIARLMRDSPVSQLDATSHGFAKVRGVVADADKLAKSPLTGTPCLYYRVRVVEGGGADTRCIVNDEWRANRLVIWDGTAAAEVALGEAKITLETDTHLSSGMFTSAPSDIKEALKSHYGESTKGIIFDKSMSFDETVLELKDTVFLIGGAVKRDGGRLEFRPHLGHLLITDHTEAKLVSSYGQNARLPVIIQVGVCLGLVAFIAMFAAIRHHFRPFEQPKERARPEFYRYASRVGRPSSCSIRTADACYYDCGAARRGPQDRSGFREVSAWLRQSRGQRRCRRCLAGTPKAAPRLTTLNLKGTDVDGSGLAHLQWHTRLRKLDLASTDVGDDALVHLRNLRALSELDLSGSQVTDVGLKHIGNCRSFTELSLASTRVTGAGLQHLEWQKGLGELCLSCTDVDDDGLAYLSRMERLSSLDLSSTGVTDGGLEHLAKLENLRFLNLASTKVNGSGLEYLAGHKLTTLDLGSTVVNSEGMQQVSELPYLVSLTLTGTLVTDEGMQHLRKHMLLETLYMKSTNVGDAGLEHLSNLRSLRRLDASGSPITDVGLSHLPSQNLQWLNLASTRVVGSRLKDLDRYEQLRLLNLCDTPLVDDALKQFGQLNGLGALFLNGTKVTDSGAGILQAAPSVPFICRIQR